ncbi:MAG: flavin reductase family protein [Actinobacteria bacterium]|nr:flavin reductase family protein [Actinomycetota bacterium]
MHYDPQKNDHGLPRDPFKSCVVPRPIGWISTVSTEGVANLAPYSQFQNLNFDPPYVFFAANQKSDGSRKDTVANAETTGQFVYNMATYDLREAVNLSAQEVPSDVDEFELAHVTKAKSIRVDAPRVAESPVNLECVWQQTIRLPGNSPVGSVDMVVGRVVTIHIKDEALDADGCLDLVKIRPLARVGYFGYTTIDSVFEMVIPGKSDELLRGLEGAR